MFSDLSAKFVNKAWGRERWIVNDKDCGVCLKEMRLEPGHQVSLHRHEKSEVFLVTAGMMLVELEDKEGESCGEYSEMYQDGDHKIVTSLHLIKPTEKIAIASNLWHRMFSVGADLCDFLEISTYHDDDDVERWPCERSR